MSTISVTTDNTADAPRRGGAGEPGGQPVRRPEASLAEQPLIAPHVWARIALIAAVFIPLHWDIIWRLIRFAATDGDWSHAFVVPLVSIFFIHQHRDELKRIQPRTCWWGLVIAYLGLAGYLLSIYPIRNDMLKGYSMIVELFGLVMLLTGPAMMKLLWFPILYLALGVKIGAKIWTFVAEKLQYIAARSATVLLNLFGIDATVHGTTIDLWKEGGFTVRDKIGSLNVAEACSGLRMLMAFIAIGVAVAYLVQRPWWARLALVLLTVPIAVFVNVCRVTVLGLLHLIDPGYTQGDFHIFVGMLMLVPALALFMLVGWLLDKIIEPADKSAAKVVVRTPSRSAPAPGQGGGEA